MILERFLENHPGLVEAAFRAKGLDIKGDFLDEGSIFNPVRGAKLEADLAAREWDIAAGAAKSLLKGAQSALRAIIL